MPRDVPLTTPALGNPNRKRVLNVLAQRRYRQRKREKFANLEKQAASTSPTSVTQTSSDDRGSDMIAPQGVLLENWDFLTEQPQVENILDDDFTVLATSQPHSRSESIPLGYMTLEPDFEILNGNVSGIVDPVRTQFNFNNSIAADTTMEMPLMKLLQTGTSFEQALNCGDLIWDLAGKWTVPTPKVVGLPEHMQPTAAQLNILHHPVFDLLPWPQLRSKLIYIFALPENVRPPSARHENALMNLIHDVEDDTEGFRVNGAGLDGGDWEVGPAFFKNWWWALDPQIVEISNAWRRRRGQNRLTMGTT